MQRAPAFSFSRIFNKIQTLENSQPLNTSRFPNLHSQPAPACRSTGRSTDPFSGRPVGRPGAQQRVGYFQSVDWAVDRALSLCTLCTSVDRAGRPITCLCGRSTRRSTEPLLLLLLAAFCCCFFFVLLSSTSSAITRRPLDDPCQLPQQ